MKAYILCDGRWEEYDKKLILSGGDTFLLIAWTKGEEKVVILAPYSETTVTKAAVSSVLESARGPWISPGSGIYPDFCGLFLDTQSDGWKISSELSEQLVTEEALIQEVLGIEDVVREKRKESESIYF